MYTLLEKSICVFNRKYKDLGSFYFYIIRNHLGRGYISYINNDAVEQILEEIE